jgi:hypothetical protein
MVAHTVDDYDLLLRMASAGLSVGSVPELGSGGIGVHERVVKNAPQAGGALVIEIESLDEVFELTPALRFATAAS